jgi:hypothetical protein
MRAVTIQANVHFQINAIDVRHGREHQLYFIFSLALAFDEINVYTCSTINSKYDLILSAAFSHLRSGVHTEATVPEISRVWKL